MILPSLRPGDEEVKSKMIMSLISSLWVVDVARAEAHSQVISC
jgi:hypothetical protein